MITTEELLLDPPHPDAEGNFKQLQDLWEEACIDVRPFISDKFCYPFTKYVNYTLQDVKSRI